MLSANFLGLGTGTVDIGNNSPTLQAINFNNTYGSTASYTIEASGTGQIIMSSGIGDAQINVLAGSHQITAPVVMYNNTDATAANGTSVVISGGLSGSATATTFSFNGAGSGSVQVVNSAPATNTVSFQVNAGGVPTLGSSHTSGTSTFSGPITLAGGANLALTAATGGQTSITGSITGGGGITVVGGGTTILSGTNYTYTGATAITNGTLRLTAPIPVSSSIIAAYTFASGTVSGTTVTNAANPGTYNGTLTPGTGGTTPTVAANATAPDGFALNLGSFTQAAPSTRQSLTFPSIRLAPPCRPGSAGS